MIVKPLRPHMESQFDSLPKEVKFCTKCVMSNQRPRITFDDKGVCSACSYRELKNSAKIDLGQCFCVVLTIRSFLLNSNSNYN